MDNNDDLLRLKNSVTKHLMLSQLSSMHDPLGLIALIAHYGVCPTEFVSGVAEIHTFCDTSELGFGACSNIRIINSTGEIHLSLLAADSRPATTSCLRIMCRCFACQARFDHLP